MAFTPEINRLMFGLLVVFFLIVGSASYWAIVGAESILLREDNPRLIEDEASIRRGSIYSRNDALLAETLVNDEGFLERIYYYPETFSFLGYSSLRYGVGGVEAAYDDYLRGDIISDELNRVIEQELLHLPQRGADIRISLDLSVQQALSNEMENRRGAAVVIRVPDGAVLGLVSLPTYNPNNLDDDWETLVESEGNPFFNRVTQGQYQPGGMLQTPLMVAGILTNQPFDIVTADANRTIEVDNRMLGCASEPTLPDLSYTEAYAFACPFPFSLLAQDLDPTSLQNIFDAFRLDEPPIISGFENEQEFPPLEVTAEVTPQLTLVEDIIGQGELTINPLGMATLAGAVINGGNAPQPYVLTDFRVEAGQWTPIESVTTTNPLMTTNAARRLQELMIANTTQGASVAAARSNLIIGGHTALAVSGEETQAWFIGFVSLGDNRGAAVAIVLENNADASEAARIGGMALEITANRLRESSE